MGVMTCAEALSLDLSPRVDGVIITDLDGGGMVGSGARMHHRTENLDWDANWRDDFRDSVRGDEDTWKVRIEFKDVPYVGLMLLVVFIG